CEQLPEVVDSFLACCTSRCPNECSWLHLLVVRAVTVGPCGGHGQVGTHRVQHRHRPRAAANDGPHVVLDVPAGFAIARGQQVTRPRIAAGTLEGFAGQWARGVPDENGGPHGHTNPRDTPASVDIACALVTWSYQRCMAR